MFLFCAQSADIITNESGMVSRLKIVGIIDTTKSWDFTFALSLFRLVDWVWETFRGRGGCLKKEPKADKEIFKTFD